MGPIRPAAFRGRHFADVIIMLCVRWYLRYSLSYRDLEEIMAERGLSVDHVTSWRWVQHFAPLLNQRLRRELRRPNGSWRVDETYVKVAGIWTYLYRAVDSAGDTIDFMLSPKRDLTAAKLFLLLALSGTGGRRPRVINVDGHPAYASAIAELKQSGDLGRRCRCRPSPYLNNIIEQDHRFIKKRIAASLGFRSADGAWRTIQGYEAMHLIRKGQIRWLPKATRWANANSSTHCSASLPDPSLIQARGPKSAPFSPFATDPICGCRISWRPRWAGRCLRAMRPLFQRGLRRSVPQAFAEPG